MVPWGIPLCTSGLFHCIDRDWLLVSKWGILLYNQLQFSIVRRTALSYDLLYFCLPAGRFTEVCVIVILHLLYPPTPYRTRVVVFKPGWLYGSSLDNAQGVFVCVIDDGWAVFDVIPVPIVCSTDVLGLRRWIWIWCRGHGHGARNGGGVVGVLSFLRNRRFLKVILPDPSTLTRYWWLGSVSTTWPVVSHWQVVGCCIVTICPLWRRHKVCVVLLYCSIKRAFRRDRIILRFFAAAIQSACGL